MKKKLGKLGISIILPAIMIIILTMPIGPLTGGLGIIEPIGGIFDYGGIVNEPIQQTITLQGLTDEVEVIIDHVGIPHIYANHIEDAFMALGYLHAKERLFQMEMQNMLAAGRISEIVGAYANSSDKFYRTIGLARSAQETLEWYEAKIATNEDVAFIMNVIDAEVAGVNMYINSMTVAQMPIEFKILGWTPRLWTRHDIFLFAKMMTWGLSGGGYYDLQREWIRSELDNDTMMEELFPDLMPNTVPIIPEQYDLDTTEYPYAAKAPGDYPAPPIPSSQTIADDENAIQLSKERLQELIQLMDGAFKPLGDMEFVGSNDWVVSGNRSETGMPILANDPHLGFQAPALWYEAHIVANDPVHPIDVTGVTLPGLPGVLLGHNDKIAWGFTNVGADVTDFYVEDLVDGNSDKYWYGGEQMDFEIIDEPILTREGTTIDFKVKQSIHGPLIDSAITRYGQGDLVAPYLAMNWTGNSITHEIMALGLLQRAQNIDDYHKAMFWWDSPGQNIVYGDVDGNIAITVTGRLPIRTGYSGMYPADGSNSSVGINEFIPFAKNPRAVNPSQGYLQSANQRSIDPSTYDYTILGPFDDGYRGRRINYLLANDDSVSIDDMKRFQADSVEVAAQAIVPYIIDAWDNATETNNTVDTAVNWLRNWDCSMETNLIAPTLWWYLKDTIPVETFDEILSIDDTIPPSRLPVLEKMLEDDYQYWFDDRSTPAIVETSEDIMVRSLHIALDKMVQAYGANTADWKFGEHHRVYLWDLLGMTYIGGGPARGGQTLNAAGSWSVVHGPSWRMVADLSNLANCWGSYPGGQSGNMFSPHYDDIFYKYWYNFTESTQQYRYHYMYFYDAPGDMSPAYIERTITFVPGVG